MRKVLMGVALAAAALAIAVNGMVGSEGEGAARTAEGRNGQFRYRDVKITMGERTRFEGRLRFEQVRNENGRFALIEMGPPAELSVDGNVCRFRGPGALTGVDNNGRRQTIRGRVAVMATDVRNRQHPEGHDLFEIHFVNEERHITFDFAGEVGRGNLAVFTRTR